MLKSLTFVLKKPAILSLLASLLFPLLAHAGRDDELNEAYTLFRAKKYAEAREEYLQIMEKHAGADWVCAKAMSMAAWCSQYQGKAKEAMAEYEEVIKTYPNIGYWRAWARYQHASLVRWHLRDSERALKEYEEIVELFPDEATTAAALCEMGRMRMQAGDYAGAESAFRKILPTCDERFQKCREVMPLLMDCLSRQGKHKEALAAAKVYFNVSKLESKIISSVTNKVAYAFKSTDNNLVRANAFLNLQKYGQAGEDGKLGTDDDISNPLSEVKVTYTEEQKSILEEAITKHKDDPRGHRMRGYIYLFLDDVDKALSEFKKAYIMSPLEGTDLQNAVDDVAIGLKAKNGTFYGTDAFLEYQKYGKNGPDGKPGTEDDLTDPLADY